MTTELTNMLVLKDSAGQYVALSQETLKQFRVPAEQAAELERAIAAAQRHTGGEETQGYAVPAAVVGVAAWAVFYWGASMGYHLTNYFMGEDQMVPNLDYSGGSRESLPAPGGGRF